MSEPETTSENQCTDISAYRYIVVSANHEVIRCQIHAEIEILRFSCFSDWIFEKVWYTIVNSNSGWLKTNHINTQAKYKYINMRKKLAGLYLIPATRIACFEIFLKIAGAK